MTRELAIGLGIVALAAFLLPLRRVPKGAPTPASRGAFDAVFHLVLAVGSIALLVLPMAARGALARIEPTASSPVLLEWICAIATLMAVSPVLALAGRGSEMRSSGEPAAVERLSRGRSIAGAFGVFALSLPGLLVLEYCVISGARAMGIAVPAQHALSGFFAAEGSARLAMFATIAIAAPIAEEAVFRGAIQPAVARISEPVIARVATACLFGALHEPLAWIPMGLFGYFLGRVRDGYGRLTPCIALHMANNALSLALYTWVPFVREVYSS
ncbi:MAG: CPBP family intramembrane metalloprotease [Planctomycetes bacterium]|nr:CPBP family intramembrane metalloprotease [Planctomycetota bacterium]